MKPGFGPRTDSTWKHRLKIVRSLILAIGLLSLGFGVFGELINKFAGLFHFVMDPTILIGAGAAMLAVWLILGVVNEVGQREEGPHRLNGFQRIVVLLGGTWIFVASMILWIDPSSRGRSIFWSHDSIRPEQVASLYAIPLVVLVVIFFGGPWVAKGFRAISDDD